MFRNAYLLSILSLSIIALSIYLDIRSSTWSWFQRSGSIVTVIGAIMGIRSYFRLGIQGMGGATPVVQTGTVKGSRVEKGRRLVDIELDRESLKAIEEDRKDKHSMLIGIIHVLVGTIIWGYGDLFGALLSKVL